MASCEECGYNPDPIWPREKRRFRREPYRSVALFWLCRSCRDGKHALVLPERHGMPRWALFPVAGSVVVVNLIWALVVILGH